MLTSYLIIQLAIAGAGPSNHTFAGFLKNNGGGFWGPLCVATIRGGQTCGQCNVLTQRSRMECPGMGAGCSPACPAP